MTKTKWNPNPNTRPLKQVSSIWRLPPQYQKPECPNGASECFVAGGQEYAQYNGKDVKGGDIKHVGNVSREQCGEKCNALAGCSSADYNPKSKACFMTVTKWAPIPKTRPLHFVNSIWKVNQSEMTCDDLPHDTCRENSKCFWAPPPNPAVEKAFQKFDKNGDGEITWREIKSELYKGKKAEFAKVKAERKALEAKRGVQW